MVNVVAAVMPLLHGLVKLAGLTPQRVEIEPGTVMNIWVPKYNKPSKPAVVLCHPFTSNGILMWFLQALALSGEYSVYVPDFLFFGGSTTNRPERTPDFQAECLAKALKSLGVERCTLVGLSYGGLVGFKMAKQYPDLVESLVVSGSVIETTESISTACLARLGYTSWPELLLPETVEGVKSLFSAGTYKLRWLPDFFYRSCLEVMFDNRKEKAELLEATVVSDEDSIIPNYPQRIHLLWGEEDNIFDMEFTKNMKRQLGDKATLRCIKKAGHLVQLERPFAFNRHLKEILASFNSDKNKYE